MTSRRVAAFAVDAILALMLTGIVLTPLLSIAPPDFWQRIDPVPLIWVVALMTIGIISGGQTPGKRWLRLRVDGEGCIVCRELRRVIWAIPVSIAEFFHSMLSADLSKALAVISALLLAWAVLRPWQRGASDFDHNTATGFAVVRRE